MPKVTELLHDSPRIQIQQSGSRACSLSEGNQEFLNLTQYSSWEGQNTNDLSYLVKDT